MWILSVEKWNESCLFTVWGMPSEGHIEEDSTWCNWTIFFSLLTESVEFIDLCLQIFPIRSCYFMCQMYIFESVIQFSLLDSLKIKLENISSSWKRAIFNIILPDINLTNNQIFCHYSLRLQSELFLRWTLKLIHISYFICIFFFFFRVFMLLSCIGQRSLSNSGVLESLLNLLDNLLSPLQPQLPMHRRTEGII